VTEAEPVYMSSEVQFDQPYYGQRDIVHKTSSEESKRILYLRRRALLMELALVEDELGIERSVKRK
jgi:hypothetical protein